MPKRLVICSDGTWNKPDQKTPTNAVKLSRAIQRVDERRKPFAPTLWQAQESTTDFRPPNVPWPVPWQ